MNAPDQHQFSGAITVFQETPAGYSALIDAYKLAVPLPRTLSAKRCKIVRIVRLTWRPCRWR
jgi:hypothetical protein